MTKLLQAILFFFITFFICSCTKVYIKEDYEFFKGQTYQIVNLPQDHFSVCSSLYGNISVIFSTAEIYCLKQNKKPQFVRKTYFTSCSLSNPVSYIFKCI